MARSVNFSQELESYRFSDLLVFTYVIGSHTVVRCILFAAIDSCIYFTKFKIDYHSLFFFFFKIVMHLFIKFHLNPAGAFFGISFFAVSLDFVKWFVVDFLWFSCLVWAAALPTSLGSWKVKSYCDEW